MKMECQKLDCENLWNFQKPEVSKQHLRSCSLINRFQSQLQLDIAIDIL